MATGEITELYLNTEYRSGISNPLEEFYRPCLQTSVIYKRAAGYFRSSVLDLIGSGLASFGLAGGQMKLICSPDLTEEDMHAIQLGQDLREKVVGDQLVALIDEMMSNDSMAQSIRVLVSLIALGVLEIRVAILRHGYGIFHEKIGVFVDRSGNRVSFKGSTNETRSGWAMDGNFESIEVFCDWRGDLEQVRVQKHEDHFDELWSGVDTAADVIALPEAVLQRMSDVPKFDKRELEEILRQHLPTSSRKPLPHQTAAIDCWVANGRRGILEHATGSGKTFTAILALKKHIANGEPAMVLVPSRLLLEQWATEISSELPHATVLLCGAGNNSWRSNRRLQAMTSGDHSLGSRITISTMQTASTDKFRHAVSEGSHLMIVADEVHQIGSPQNARFFDLVTGPRIGLSATPTRYGDPEGTLRLLEYFGGVVPPPFTIYDAIRAGRLVPYEYFPHPVHLSEEESDKWSRLTVEIGREIARNSRNSESPQISDRAKMLMINRSRIAKSAKSKVPMAGSVLSREYKDGQHWLVYCEDQEQMNLVAEDLVRRGISSLQYYSDMPGDRIATMEWFKTFGGVMLSIRCLDEGVDIPDASHAMILASSQNPRQFIQRRGRILRTAPNKTFGIIHDAIVVPSEAVSEEPDYTSLLKSEMLRALEFSRHASNSVGAARLREIAVDMGLDPETVSDSGMEEEGEDE